MEPSLLSLIRIRVDNDIADIDALRLQTDPTLFSNINVKYQQLMHKVMMTDSVPGLDREALAKFKQRFEDTAYICRYADCPGRSMGFSSTSTRDDHEKLRHGQGIVCTEPSCLRNHVGFKTSEQLRRHIQTAHGSAKLTHRFKRTRLTEDGQTLVDPLRLMLTKEQREKGSAVTLEEQFSTKHIHTPVQPIKVRRTLRVKSC